MNKILTALVLAVVMSGNAHAGVNHLFCSNDSGLAYGYEFESNQRLLILYYYSYNTDLIETEIVEAEWLPKTIYIAQHANFTYKRNFRINREDLTIEKETNSYYKNWGKCELISDTPMLVEKVREYSHQEKKNNKF